MIKIALRRNLIYPLQLLIWKVVRDIEIQIIYQNFEFDNSFIYTPLMFLGEFFAGLILFKYEKNFITKNKAKNTNKTYWIELIKTDPNLNPIDGNKKIQFLIFVIASSDFIQFLIRFTIIPKYIIISSTLQNRLASSTAFIGAIFYVYVLKIKIYKHHIFSFVIMGICLLIIIIFEYIFQEINIFLSYKDFTVVLLIMFATNLFENLIDTIEKYLYEYDFVDPFKVLMFQGLYGFLISFSLFYFPFTKDLKKIYYNNSVGCFVLFIFLLIVYFILCGGKNASRVITTKLFSPMTRVFTDHFLNPFYLIYYYATDNDFKTDNELNNGFYFTINLIISIINSFCSLVFNEILICFFCGLERNTHNQISIRAESKFEINLSEIIDDDDETSQASII